MSDLTEFLLAQIAEDERRAQTPLSENYWESIWPRRVLAQCAAFRAIVERAEMVHSSWRHRYEEGAGSGAIAFPDVSRRERSHAYSTLVDLASIYADREGCREEWR